MSTIDTLLGTVAAIPDPLDRYRVARSLADGAGRAELKTIARDAIATLVDTDGWTLAALAREFGVTYQAIQAQLLPRTAASPRTR